MAPLVALVGRPNVGKSTLFNRLTRTRQALVDDIPGVTRDRLYGRVEADGREFTLVDTGGFDPPADQPFAHEVHAQIEMALEESDAVIFLADVRAGLNPMDLEVAGRLRKIHKPVIYAVNKVDSPALEDQAAEFYALGAENLVFLSAAHGTGLGELLERVLAVLPPEPEETLPEEGLEVEGGEEGAEAGPEEIRVALLGRPNVGKSSLLNALVGAPRVVVSDVPGTTRDAIDTPLTWRGRPFTIIDTAGIRRRGKVQRGLEKAGVFRSLRAIDRAQVVVCLIDASEGVTDQDLHLVGQVVDAHRGLVVGINKWDLIQGQTRTQRILEQRLDEALKFAPWAPRLKLSAKTGHNVESVLEAVEKVHADYGIRIGTGQLNAALEEMVERHTPPMVKGRRIKFYYASQVATRPPTIVIFVNDPPAVHFSYRRYLMNEIRRVMGVEFSPVRLIFRQRSGRHKWGESPRA